MISFNYNKNSQKIKSSRLHFTLIPEFNAIFITCTQFKPYRGNLQPGCKPRKVRPELKETAGQRAKTAMKNRQAYVRSPD